MLGEHLDRLEDVMPFIVLFWLLASGWMHYLIKNNLLEELLGHISRPWRVMLIAFAPGFFAVILFVLHVTDKIDEQARFRQENGL